MTDTIQINGAALTPLHDAALWWDERRTLVVSDLHFEKGSAFAAAGSLLPPYDTRATLARLRALVDRVSPQRVISLGDSIHDGGAIRRIDPDDAAVMQALTRAMDWIWIAGNHDPVPPECWGGRCLDVLTDGPLTFRHQAEPGAVGEISGHYHPKARVRTRAKRVSVRCFVHDGERLIMPAFGAYTGGLDVTDPAIAGLLRRDFTVDVIGRKRLVRVPNRSLIRKDPARRYAGAGSL